MFENTEAFSGFAVSDIPAAVQFYGDTLGMRVTEEYGLARLHVAGGHDVLVYPTPGHTPAAYTILNFPVDDIEATVDQLTGRGISFLRYEDFEQDAKGISHEGPVHIAWFTDPAGNVLAVIQEK